ncbi:MAG: hypothetical protein FIB01_02445 [Gemmatimonadetes bacterium]|nr:hypothetical protein [Gemmatimonadota bacterium]
MRILLRVPGVIMSHHKLALLAALLAFACAGDRPRAGSASRTDEPPADDITIARDSALRETTFTLVDGDCRISWTVYESELNREVIRHRSDCALSLAGQAPLIGRLLRRVLEPGTGAAGFRTLSWGRLYPDDARDATMPVRLALAAMRSPGWDAAVGRPRSGDINGWVRQAANDARIYEELVPVFREVGLELTLAGVEKVLVQKAELLPFFAELQEAGVRPGDRVPFDCQTWFSVTRGGPGPR